MAGTTYRDKLAMSLTDAENREQFAAGGNIYLLVKIGGAVGQNLPQIGARMRGESLEMFLETRAGHRGTAEPSTRREPSPIHRTPT